MLSDISTAAVSTTFSLPELTEQVEPVPHRDSIGAGRVTEMTGG
jgi:hypothetical protein